ncbi:MAG: valine--tRNA ligase [Actinomycetota bacterium]
MTEHIPKAYEPAAIEGRWYPYWETSGFFRADPASEKPPWSLVIPPPNVTGALHMGHAFGHTHMDLYARRARMQGCETLFLPGMDHAGIATQNVVERELAKEGTDRHQLGRDAFVERVWAWKEEYGGKILGQMRKLGIMADWERERFTMDEGLSRAVRTVFVRWFEDGLIYRGNRIINWCPRCTTALSDIEVEHEDVAGEIITFRYMFEDGSGGISVATTRIETMLGDTGVAVHPDDERYRDAIGKRLVHPFFPERELRVVADEAVDPEFGTGAVKATPAHDPTDFEIGERNDLAKINIFDTTAHVTDEGGVFAGQDRYEARKNVLEALEQTGVVEKVERPYVHPVGHCYRCHTEIEPWLSEQWFVSMKPLAGPAIEVVKDKRVDIVPERFAKQYIDWMENIRDWCISRQIWWGHRIPVWYCDECNETIVALEDPVACTQCGLESLQQDEDVLDTWFSSQLFPFSTLGWPDDTPDLSKFYPTTLMVTGYEILFLWIARMIFSGVYFMDEVPFKNVLIHGIVRDKSGKKMSKSLGNVVDPLDLIERHGADALRFSLAGSAASGNDVNFSDDRIDGAGNFANKLWNASRFVLMSLGEERPELPGQSELSLADRWILSRLDATVKEYDRHLHAYSLAEATRTLHRFIWSEYCDWYIELAKMELSGERAGAPAATLTYVLDNILRLLHPVMPFITEELWQRLRPDAGSIMDAAWPEPSGTADDEAEAALDAFRDLVTALRRAKIDHGLPQGQKLTAYVAGGPDSANLSAMEDAIVMLARLGSVTFVDELPTEGAFAKTVTTAGFEAALDLGGTVDLDAERSRLEKKISELDFEVRRAESKLANENFVAKAPAAVVDKERARLEEVVETRAKLQGQLDALGL